MKMKEKSYLILGYAAPGNAMKFSSMAKTVGDLAVKIKSLLISESTKDFNVQELYLDSSEFLLTTNTLIAEKFGLEDVREAIVVIFEDSAAEKGSKVYSVLEKRSEDQKEEIQLEPMIKSLQKLFFKTNEKDEL